MRQAFLKFEHWTSGIALAAACVLLVIAASLGMYQIITRFVIESPAEWTEVLTRFTLIWMVFMGIPYAFRHGAMVCVDVLYRWSSPKVRRALDWMVCGVSLTMIGLIIWWGWDYAQRGSVQTMAGLESVSMFWAYLAMPVGGVFAVIGIIGQLLDPRRIELEVAQ